MSAPSSSSASTPLSEADAALANAPHPKGLYVLFFTEMWERFSYYGMRALLMTYMVSPAFGLQPSQASGYYKWYTSLVYLTPLFGGLIADRLIGLRSAIFAGAILMAIGHFLMAFPTQWIFFTALVFLIIGNGFFKPNISTMVGRMYTKDDPRRDRAFTIFYMGINLGSFLSSILCPWLSATKGFHWGFGAAGVGMVIGLLVFTFGQRQATRDVEAAGNSVGRQEDPKRITSVDNASADYRTSAVKSAVDTDASLPRAGGFAEKLADVYPIFMIVAAIAIVVVFGVQFARGEVPYTKLIMPIAFGAVFTVMAVLLMRLKGRQKDKSVTIFIMFLFPVLFWMAFEQAGNALNLWAEDHTNRTINVMKMTDYPGGWWQSANALMIFALAPVFAILWSVLNKARREPSTPVKMFLAMGMMVLSFLIMVFGAASENSTKTEVSFAAKLGSSVATANFADLAGTRLKYGGPCTGEYYMSRPAQPPSCLTMNGVLPDYTVRDVLAKTTPAEYRTWINELEKGAGKAKKAAPFRAEYRAEFFEITKDPSALKDLKLEAVSPGHFKNDSIDILAEEGGKVTVIATDSLEPAMKAELFVAASDPEWKKALKDLAERSHAARVSGIWLFLSYLLATLGELCLSPVGLSMVTKLAPARFASLFMGVWLLSSSVAQYVGGSIGEKWGEITPSSYFWIFVATSIFGSVLVLALVKPLKKLMHDVA